MNGPWGPARQGKCQVFQHQLIHLFIIFSFMCTSIFSNAEIPELHCRSQMQNLTPWEKAFNPNFSSDLLVAISYYVLLIIMKGRDVSSFFLFQTKYGLFSRTSSIIHNSCNTHLQFLLFLQHSKSFSGSWIHNCTMPKVWLGNGSRQIQHLGGKSSKTPIVEWLISTWKRITIKIE